MNKAYNSFDAEILKHNKVPVYKLSNKLKYHEYDSSGNETFYKKFINNEGFY
ncbi:hypothetical protein I8R70_25470 [Klebsiella pneumoniae]|nr:hypothetical protein [Klebsiella pneumoniae]MBH8501203.1 hypothetical protein [Klebsiella pneumoniae]HBR5433322.1 hypothetical protein [Klebsiella pneumoniae]HBT2406763.1 hypothetical protein [Klebsiella pneumoniae subsp. pneumoniae]HCQ7436742.1 hypothetical protein [Klebsiella pneumoniae]